ncbi:MAG: hypothetical protein EZS28_023334 [Streblomastix strix]|uniref:Transmembrane protein n=1 Tax=Streblomastix strix TaxID=222440 RepID=A0A5J4VFG8_9EUKA|nr:MAG: hypothetical protein EZS28_023334 [Streblomastix strix]
MEEILQKEKLRLEINKLIQSTLREHYHLDYKYRKYSLEEQNVLKIVKQKALMGRFFIFISQILEEKVSETPNIVSLSSVAVQDMASLMNYDLRGGCTKFRKSLMDYQTQSMNNFQIILILFFILGLIFSFTGYLLCFYRTRSTLFLISDQSAKMKYIDPSFDANFRNGMGGAAWKDEYSCDSMRLDNIHKRILLSLACCCGCIDAQMNIDEQRIQMEKMQEESYSDEFNTLLICIHQVQNVRMMGKQGNFFNGKEGRSGIKKMTIVDYEDLNNVLDSSSLQFIAQTTLKAFDLNKKEEKENENDEEFRPVIHPSNAQLLKQLYIQWLVHHVSKTDRELSQLIIGKAPESELETDITIPPAHQFITPKSFKSFLESDKSTQIDKVYYERMKKLFKMEEFVQQQIQKRKHQPQNQVQLKRNGQKT